MATHEPELRYRPEVQPFVRPDPYRGASDAEWRALRPGARCRWRRADEAEAALLPEPDRSLAIACPVLVRMDLAAGGGRDPCRAGAAGCRAGAAGGAAGGAGEQRRRGVAAPKKGVR